MKRQTRPFSIEIKTSRKPNLPLRGASRPHSDWIDPFPEEVPERDVHEDVIVDERSEAFRQAEQLFGRASTLQQKPATDKVAVPPEAVTSEVPAAPASQVESRAPRILPDLIAQARDDERNAQEQLDLERARHRPALKRSPAAAKPKRPKKLHLPVSDELPLEGPPVPQPAPVTSALVVALPSPTGGQTSSFDRERRSGELPLGQRWKERRLPRVCWDQPGLRKRQRG